VKTNIGVRSWYLVALGYFCLFAFGLVDNVRGPVFPDLLRDYALSDTVGGLFFLIASTTGLVNNVLLFKWIEKIGAYRTTQVYTLAQAIGLVVIGVSTTYPVTLLGAMIIGTSLGGLGISVNVLVIEGALPSWRRQALSGLHCMYGVASLLAPLMVSVLYHFDIGWRGVLGWSALGPLAVLLVTFLRNPHRVEAEETAAHKADDQSRPIVAALTGERLARARRLGLYFALIGTFYVVAEISISSRLALFARRDWGYDTDAANWLLAIYFLGMFIGRFVSAVFQLPWKTYSILVFAAVLGLVTYALGLTVHPTWMAIAGLFLSVFYPYLISLISEEQEEISGYITSWCITVQSFGIMAMHLILGKTADLFGLGRALWLGPFCLVMVLICLGLKGRFAPLSLGTKRA
jgi:MFS transporter, FHS family, glucose/mannose:H+ symporter